MMRVLEWIRGLAAMMVSAFGSFRLVMVYTDPDGEFNALLALPIMFLGVVLGILHRRRWAGLAAIVLPIVVFTFLSLGRVKGESA
jgi:hypothetical protein